MFNGHMDTSYSGREPWLRDVPGFQPSAFERDGRLYGLGISNMKGALACYVEAVRALADDGRAAARRRADRRRLRRDREDAVRRGAGRAVPRLRRRLALPRHARRRRRHVPARRADRGQGRARPLRRALAAHPRARRLHPHRLQRGPARPELDPAHARRARRGAGVDSRLGERPVERLPRREGDRRTSARSRAASAGASRGRRITPTSSSTCACRRRSRWRSRGARCSTWCAGSPSASPTYGVEGEVYVTAPGAEIDEGHELVARDRRRARGRSSARSRSATSRAGSATRPRSRATASRP